MNKLAILHHELDNTEVKLRNGLLRRGHKHVDLLDVRWATLEDLLTYGSVLNRVYSSIADHDVRSVERCKQLIGTLEEQGILCINNYLATCADYDKYLTYQVLKKAGVPTPVTQRIDHQSVDTIKADVEQFAREYGFPLVVKRNLGGRGVGVFRIESVEQLIPVINIILKQAHNHQYNKGWVVQEFISATKPCDCRVSVMFGHIVHVCTRTFVTTSSIHGGSSSQPWIAGRCHGSVVEPYQLSDKERKIIHDAVRAVKAEINGLDIIFGPEDQFIVLEDNTTPQFFHENDEDTRHFELFLDKLSDRLIHPT